MTIIRLKVAWMVRIRSFDDGDDAEIPKMASHEGNLVNVHDEL